MMLFWLICAVLVAIALAFVLPPLLQQVAGGTTDDGKTEANLDVYRDQLSELDADLRNGITSPEQYQQDRDGIERRLLEDVAPGVNKIAKPVVGSSLKHWGTALVVSGACSFLVPLLFQQSGEQFRAISLLAQAQPAIGIVLLTFGGLFLLMKSNRSTAYGLALAVPIMALSIYLKVGDLHASESNAAANAGPGMTQQGIETNVAALAKRMEQNPNDAEGWTMLGRSYLQLEKYSEATNAYAKAAALKTDDADLLSEYAFTMAMANGRQLQGQPLELIKRALELDPKNGRALNLAGSAAYQQKNFKQAIEYWQRELDASANAEERARVTQMIEEAKAQSVGPSGSPEK
jgi:cytochrome c-type biogenesis protein CcmH